MAEPAVDMLDQMGLSGSKETLGSVSHSLRSNNLEWEDVDDEEEERPLLSEAYCERPGLISVRPPDRPSSAVTAASFRPEQLSSATQEDLQERISTLRTQRSQLREQMVDAKIALADSRPDRCDELDDAYFTKRVMVLRYMIQQWSHEFFNNSSWYRNGRAH